METTNKEVVEKKTYVHDDRHDDYTERKARNGYGMGLAGVLTGGAALLSQWSNGRGIFGGTYHYFNKTYNTTILCKTIFF